MVITLVGLKQPLRLVLSKHDYFDFDGTVNKTKLDNKKIEISIFNKNAAYQFSKSFDTQHIISETVDIFDQGSHWLIYRVINKYPIGDLKNSVTLEEHFISNGNDYVLTNDSHGIISSMEKTNDTQEG